MSHDKIVIYCDGACSGNQFRGNRGGWGAVLKYKDTIKEIWGGEDNTTNQRMEITACVKALEQLKKPGIEIEIYSDSAYLVNCINQKWYQRWQKNGWKTYRKQPVENKDLWLRLLNLLSKHKATFHKVKGHSTSTLNELADTLARNGITRSPGAIRFTVKKDKSREPPDKPPAAGRPAGNCPICGGTGRVQRRKGPRTKASITTVCTTCVGRGSI